MKVVTPEISWHERDPIYSIDFQPGRWPIQRLASGGVDKIVRIWRMTVDEEGKGDFEFLSNLRRHTATVNIVRFSKNGNLLATAGDDQAIILWKLSEVPTPANNIFADEEVEEDKETWVCYKSLRGHLGDVADLSWSKDNRYLVSGSVDNTAIVWDVVKGTKQAIFSEHKSYVQGVAFDPLGNFVATLSADRSLRIYNTSSKCCVNNVSKMSLPAATPAAPPPPAAPPAGTTSTPHTPSSQQPEAKPKSFRIFHDDSLRSFFRRLEFSPDGQLLIAPAGCMEVAGKLINASFVFARGAFSKPALYLPSSDKSSLVVRVNPQLYQLRPVESSTEQETEKDGKPEWEKHKSLFCLPYRIVFAVATEDSVLIYDTQQTMPVGLLRNIHYHQISDLSWSRDGRALMVSSTDGFCTVATFEENELGIPYSVGDGGGDALSTLQADPVSPASVGVEDRRTKGPAKKTPAAPLSTPADVKAAESSTVTDKSPGVGNSSSLKDGEGGQSPPKQKNGEGRQMPSEETKPLKSPARTEHGDGTSKEKAVIEDVQDLKIQESSSTTGSSPSTKEEPKKKRIQFTTLSLINK